MATSGQIRTYEVDDGTYFYVDWQRTGYDNVGNYSDIGWQLNIHCRWYYGSNAVKPHGVYINNSQVYGGGTFSGLSAGDHQLASGTTRIYHNTDGTKTFNINLSGWVVDGGETNGSQDFTLDALARFAVMTSANNFNDEGNPTFQFNNPANTSMSCWLEPKPDGQHLAIRTFSGTGGRYTWTLTEEERTQLRNKCTDGNSCKCRIGLYSTLGGQTIASFKDVTMSIVNANPVFSDFDFEDINTTTVALTGNNKKNVNGYSNIQATITTQNKAVGKKGASIVEYRLTIGNKTEKVSYSSDSDVSVVINGASTGVYQLYAVDSRGNTTLVSKVSQGDINYVPITIDNLYSKAYRSNNGSGAFGYIKYQGTLWNGDFGAETNDIENVYYQFKKTNDSEWITGTTDITPAINDNNFSFNDMVRSDNPDYKFDLDASYNFRIFIEDKLSITMSELPPMASSIPNLSINKNGIGIMCNYDPILGGELQVAGSSIIDSGEGFIKYYDGTMICYGKKEKITSIVSTWGNIYLTGAGNFILDDFAKEFIETPTIIVSAYGNTYNCWVGQDGDYRPSKTSPGGIILFRATSLTSQVSFTAQYIAIGKWK